MYRERRRGEQVIVHPQVKLVPKVLKCPIDEEQVSKGRTPALKANT
jgi:hypothetical protein